MPSCILVRMNRKAIRMNRKLSKIRPGTLEIKYNEIDRHNPFGRTRDREIATGYSG